MPDISNEEFLAHFGVKGMKWGVRQNRDSGGSVKKQAKKPIGNGDGKVSADEAKAAGVQAAKIALKYGAPSAAVAVGATVGLPAVAALGVSVRVLQDPGIQDAIGVGARFAKDIAPDMSKIKLPDIDVPKMPKFFGSSTTTEFNGRTYKDGKLVDSPSGTKEWMLKDGTGYTPVNWPADRGVPPSLDTVREMQASGEIPK
jgi:hypothetical protein